MKDINDLKKSDTWKIQLTIVVSFMFSKENDKNCVMHSKSNNIEFMIYENADGTIEEHFESPLSRYQIATEISMRGNDFIFDVFIY